VWPLSVVVDHPIIDDSAGLWQVAKEVLVEAFITQSPVKRFNKAVLHLTHQ
jgi:hypothetical protein